MFRKWFHSFHKEGNVTVTMGFDFAVGNQGESILIETNRNMDNVRMTIFQEKQAPIIVLMPKDKFKRFYEGCLIVIKELDKETL